MEEKEPGRIPEPGLSEAIHPEIGNGLPWEADIHKAILRNPDPSKELDTWLTDPDTREEILKNWAKGEMLNGPVHTNLPAPQLPEISRLPETRDQTPGVEKTESKVTSPVEGPGPSSTKTKPRPKKSMDKSGSGEVTEGAVQPENLKKQPEKEITKGKAPKAGKLIKKAAKTVRKQESKKDEKRQEAAQVMTHSDPNLSPFTLWLKSLRGSDYVHPYEDDFAIHQGEWPVKEGISETFADLLAAQGHKERAIEMYRRLMKKYPEKSSFFAAKIEGLQY